MTVLNEMDEIHLMAFQTRETIQKHRKEWYDHHLKDNASLMINLQSKKNYNMKFKMWLERLVGYKGIPWTKHH